MAKTHGTAIVEDGAKIADGVEIGPYCLVGPNVEIGEGCRLVSHCNVQGHTTIGPRGVFHPFCSIGTEPEDYHYKGELSYTRVGSDATVREGVTINRATTPGGTTSVGNGCILLAKAHVAHDSTIGDNVVMVVCSGVAGHVQVGAGTLLAGYSGVHQFCRVGRFCVLSGGSMISLDLPPFMIGEGRNGAVKSLNLVGLKRNHFTLEQIRTLKELFKIFFRSGLNVSNAIQKIEAELPPTAEVREFIDFVRSSKRGVLHGRDIGRRS